jgi:hypothetical protein
MARKRQDSSVDIWCALCEGLIAGNAEVYVLRDRRLVHQRCVLKARLDPLTWIHAHGTHLEIVRYLAEHRGGYAYPPGHPSAERPPLEADPQAPA